MSPVEEPRSKLLSLTVHELRTPLTVVAGYVRMVLRERAGPVPEAQRKLLEEAEKSCGKLSSIVAQLSDLSNLEAGTATFNRASVSLGPLVAQVASELSASADPPVSVEARTPDEGPVVEGDPVRLQLALGAIAQSLLREIPRDGKLIVECRRDGARTRVDLGEASVFETLRATELDNLGVFDEWRGGMGLGLPIARRAIEQHGGRAYSPLGAHAKLAAVLVLPIRTAP